VGAIEQLPAVVVVVCLSRIRACAGRRSANSQGMSIAIRDLYSGDGESDFTLRKEYNLYGLRVLGLD
jgi:hypothetical protein